MAHVDVASYLAVALGLLAVSSLTLLLFGQFGIGSIVAFLVAGLVTGQVRDIDPQRVMAVREIAEIGVALLLFVIGLEIKPPQLRELGRDALVEIDLVLYKAPA